MPPVKKQRRSDRSNLIPWSRRGSSVSLLNAVKDLSTLMFMPKNRPKVSSNTSSRQTMGSLMTCTSCLKPIPNRTGVLVVRNEDDADDFDPMHSSCYFESLLKENV